MLHNKLLKALSASRLLQQAQEALWQWTSKFRYCSRPEHWVAKSDLALMAKPGWGSVELVLVDRVAEAAPAAASLL